jgi:death on curing protein
MVIEETGGAAGLRDLAALESAIAQPRMTFGGQDLYPSLTEKAAALCFSLVSNHPFVDGNKRVGHAAMETFLLLNGFEIVGAVEEQERLVLALAAGELSREDLLTWLQSHVEEV